MGAAAVGVVVHQAGERLGAVGRHQRHAHGAAGVDVGEAREQRRDDLAGAGGREHRAVDLGRRRQRLELPVELARHSVERRAHLLELVPATDRDAAAEIPPGDAPGALLQLPERGQAPPDAIHAQDQHDGRGCQHQEEQGVGEPDHRSQDFRLGMAEDEVPGGRGEYFVQQDGPGGRDVRIPVEGRQGIGIGKGVEPQGLERGLNAGDRAHQDVAAIVLHREDGAGRDQALVERGPEIVRVDLAHQEPVRPPRATGALAEPPHQVGPGGTPRVVLRREERKAFRQVEPVALGQTR